MLRAAFLNRASSLRLKLRPPNRSENAEFSFAPKKEAGKSPFKAPRENRTLPLCLCRRRDSPRHHHIGCYSSSRLLISIFGLVSRYNRLRLYRRLRFPGRGLHRSELKNGVSDAGLSVTTRSQFAKAWLTRLASLPPKIPSASPTPSLTRPPLAPGSQRHRPRHGFAHHTTAHRQAQTLHLSSVQATALSRTQLQTGTASHTASLPSSSSSSFSRSSIGASV